MRKFKLGIQLYTVREPLAKDFEGTLRSLAEMGFEGVELAFFYGGLEPDALAGVMKKIGLEVCGIYEGFDNICDPACKVYEYAGAVGCEYLTSGLGLQALKDDFAGCVDKCREACAAASSRGMSVCYHAHAHEFETLGGGIIMDRLLSEVEEMAFEADTAWIKFGGQDPAGYIRKNLTRIPMAHFKDVKADGSITELGEGVVDFPAVLDVIRGSNVGWVSYEQDVSSIGALVSAGKSMDYIKKII